MDIDQLKNIPREKLESQLDKICAIAYVFKCIIVVGVYIWLLHVDPRIAHCWIAGAYIICAHRHSKLEIPLIKELTINHINSSESNNNNGSNQEENACIEGKESTKLKDRSQDSSGS